MSTVSNNGKLTNLMWSDVEMEDISWHDSHIRAMLLSHEGTQLLLDIDFICEWIEPQGQRDVFSFYIAPATLVFPYAQDIQLFLSSGTPMSIFSIDKHNPAPTPRGNASIWEWTIDGPHGQMSLRSSGFVLYFRHEPILTQGQHLSLQDRGGICFDIPGGYES